MLKRLTNFRTFVIAVLTWWAGFADYPLAASKPKSPSSTTSGATKLPNGWRLTPAGSLIALPGDMPLKMTAMADGKSMLIVTAGFHDHGICVIDLEKETLGQRIELGKDSQGLAINHSQGKVYVAGGGPAIDLEDQPEFADLSPEMKSGLAQPILSLNWKNGSLAFDRSLPIEGLREKDRFVMGLGLDGRGHLLAVNFQTDSLLKLDEESGRVLAGIKLGYRPGALAQSFDADTVAVANWGDKSVSIVDTTTLKERSRISVGTHPTDLAFARDGRIFVANAGSNSISVIKNDGVIETIMTSLDPNDPVGSTPNSLAVSDDKRLYVANADNNDIAVIDIHEGSPSRVVGFIPTGWYPSALALTPDGKRLVVGLAKGIGSRANWPGLLGSRMTKADGSSIPFDYVGQAMTGFAEIIPIPDAKQLDFYTRQVRSNSPTWEHDVSAATRQEAKQAFRKIKHVVYIIRENRTYDEILGDETRGDGVAELAYFGRKLTPNVHALVEQSPLLDRYFVNGDVSADGHNWANGAYVPSYLERATAAAYGGRGQPDADDRLWASPAGWLWDRAKQAGLSYYSYGEMAPDAAYEGKTNFVTPKALKGHSYPEWGVNPNTGPFEKDDVTRAQLFIKDLRAAEKSGNWPNYIVMSLPWDHTVGLSPGKMTPEAAIASNDLGLGLIVEAISHSRFWSSTAIFVTEDDAQAGPDHIDDHRSVALVVSPYAKINLVDHTPYTMVGMVRTMEEILHVPPMSQYDRDATPMYRLFQAKSNLWTYSARPETVDLKAVNPSNGPLAEASSKLDFSNVDRADPEALNVILWKALKPGTATPMPVRSAFAGIASLGER